MRGLEVRGLNKSFGGISVAQDINFDLPPGARKALIGPNGAGKSTFANLVTGILQPSQGDILLDGVRINEWDEATRVRAGIAKTFQITTLFRGLSVQENLRIAIQQGHRLSWRLFASSTGDADVERAIDALLDEFQLGSVAETRVDELAYGQQRLVEIALVLGLRPRVLILDEPAAGVPTSETHLIVEAIENLPADLAVLVIEHDMELVFRLAQSIVVLVDGRILMEGTPDRVMNDPTVQELYLGGGHE